MHFSFGIHESLMFIVVLYERCLAEKNLISKPVIKIIVVRKNYFGNTLYKNKNKKRHKDNGDVLINILLGFYYFVLFYSYLVDRVDIP